MVEPANMSDRVDTSGSPAPDTDQPPAPLAAPWPRTFSENVTFICVSDTAVAFVIFGGWPSSRACSYDISVPRALPAESAMAVRSTVMSPVSLVDAFSPVNVITCSAEGSPAASTGVRAPPCARFRLVYADATRETGSLYVMVTLSAPVMFAERTAGLWPSSRACSYDASVPR